ncbi:MAG: hypothetical protein ACYC3G_03430 [Minisyncoccota bacterium]
MDKFIGTILMVAVIVICFYIFMNMEKLNSVTVPIPEKVVEYFKVEPFNPSANYNSSTIIPQ